MENRRLDAADRQTTGLVRNVEVVTHLISSIARWFTATVLHLEVVVAMPEGAAEAAHLHHRQKMTLLSTAMFLLRPTWTVLGEVVVVAAVEEDVEMVGVAAEAKEPTATKRRVQM